MLRPLFDLADRVSLLGGLIGFGSADGDVLFLFVLSGLELLLPALLPLRLLPAGHGLPPDRVQAGRELVGVPDVVYYLGNSNSGRSRSGLEFIHRDVTGGAVIIVGAEATATYAH